MGDIRLEPVATGFDFPTSIALDDEERVYVAESGLAFGGAAPGDGSGGSVPTAIELLVDGLRPPVNGVAARGAVLYLSEGGHPQRISRLDTHGSLSTDLEGLPGPGNYQLNTVAVGPDGTLYFSQGDEHRVIGFDAYELGWLHRRPHAHDVPGYDIVLGESNVETPARRVGGCPHDHRGVLSVRPAGASRSPPPRPGPGDGAVMRCDPNGSGLELVAWDLRNAYGLCFLPDGRLLAVDQGPDDRGSRPIGNAPDLLFEVRRAAGTAGPTSSAVIR